MKTLVFNKDTHESILNEFKTEYKLVLTKEINTLKAPLSSHTDMQIADLGNGVFVCEPSVFEYYNMHLKGAKIICGTTHLTSNYPNDIAYNIARVGDKCLCCERYTDKKILENFDGKIINIKQGYAKCNICVVDDNSVITSDDGIEKECIKCGIDVLKISNAQINLQPFDYGFIGGASFKINKNSLCFFGDIKRHTDYEKILLFCASKGVDVTHAGNVPLSDYGGAIILN